MLIPLVRAAILEKYKYELHYYIGMVISDFVVKYNPATETAEDVAHKIIYSIFIKRRIKARKPAVVFVGGDSGEGKSYSVIALQKILLEMQGVDIRKCLNIINVYTPLEYPQKLDKILFDKEFKKVNIIAVHEARDVVKAKEWNSFVTQAVADVNAQSRSIKRLIVFITSQFIRDITTDIRYTLNYYCIVKRPIGSKARIYINIIWKDDRDLEKPKIRKRKLTGYLVYPNGRYKKYIPKYLEVTMPAKELREVFEQADRNAKEKIIKSKLNRLIKNIEASIGVESENVSKMVEFYAKNPENISSIGKRVASTNKWKVKKEFKEMHKLSKEEAAEFELLLNKKLLDKGIIEHDKERETTASL